MYALYFLAEEGPDASLSLLLWLALGFFFLMVVIGWWVSRNKVTGSAGEHAAHTHEKESTDDLTVIEGIGPKVVQVLKTVGIASFADLAHADAGRVQEALNEAGLQYMSPEGWIEQAGLAAKGDMEALSRLQDTLKGGRKS